PTSPSTSSTHNNVSYVPGSRKCPTCRDTIHSQASPPVDAFGLGTNSTHAKRSLVIDVIGLPTTNPPFTFPCSWTDQLPACVSPNFGSIVVLQDN
ncbi:unnamed protein product, partial [Colletotrichum noveboracense]